MNMHTPVDLGDDLERAVARMVREGRYATRDDALRAGVRALQDREMERRQEDGPDLGDPMEAVRQGLADIEAGRVTDADVVFDRLIKKYTDLAKR